MLLYLNTIADGRSVLSQRVRIEGEQASWLFCAEDLKCRAEIDNIQTQISVHLFYEGAVRLECSRCLKQFDFPVKGDFYSIIKKRSSENRHLSSVEDECDFFYDDTTEALDIRGVLFDEIFIGLPMKPLCSDMCEGFPLRFDNEHTAVEKKDVDPRWETLRKLAHKEDKSL